jgi:hypothetical protein
MVELQSQLRISVDIHELRIQAVAPQELQGIVAKAASVSGVENDVHGAAATEF